MICEDWRDAPSEVVAPLYDAETARWHRELGWDMRPSWDIVEEARAAGRLPGWLIRDEPNGAIAGWTFFLLYAGTLQIGALNGTSARVVRELLQAIVRSPEAALARELSCFLFPASAAVAPALARQRFGLRQSLYLSCDLTSSVVGRSYESVVGQSAQSVVGRSFLTADLSAEAARAKAEASAKAVSFGSTSVVPVAQDFSPASRVPEAEFRVRGFTLGDEPSIVRLLAFAYQGLPSAACFAPNGRREEWVHYVRQILTTPACGALLRDASFVAHSTCSEQGVGPASSPGLFGAVLTSRIAPDTAHIVQVAVDPAFRRRGIAEALVDRACAAGRDAGFHRITLLVDEENAAARALYERRGFRPASAFLFGTRKAIRTVAAA